MTPHGRSPRRSWLPVLAGAGLASCNWVSLAANAVAYRTTAAGEAANVTLDAGYAYHTLAGSGLGVLDPSTGETLRVLPPPAGSASVDDLAAADGLLFLLDARPPGYLSVLTLQDPRRPRLVSGPVAVDVGPFSGVSAGGGRVVVSGGTSELSLRAYAADGGLGAEVATIDLGRGQPDVLLAPDGRRAFVSTHDWGPYFSLTTLAIEASPLALSERGVLKLEGAGFTAGGAKPASFPIEAALVDDATLLVAFAEGLAIVDVSTLDRPTLVRVLEVGVSGVNVDAAGGVAAVVGSAPEPRLVLVDLANPRDPTIRRAIPLPSDAFATGVAVGPAHAVVAAHGRGALVVPF